MLIKQRVTLWLSQTTLSRERAHEFFELPAGSSGNLFRKISELQFERKIQRFADEVPDPSLLVGAQRRIANEPYFDGIEIALDELELPSKGIGGQPLRFFQLMHQRGEGGGITRKQGRPGDAGHRT